MCGFSRTFISLISLHGASSDSKRERDKRNGAFGQSKRAQSVVMRGPLGPYLHARLPDRYPSCIPVPASSDLHSRAYARTQARTRVRVYGTHASLVRTASSRFYWRHAAPRLDTRKEEEEEEMSRSATFLHFSIRVLLFENNYILLITDELLIYFT